MKHIKLPIILILCLAFSSIYLQSAQPTWWERSKNYAASWVPQAAQQKAAALHHTYLSYRHPIVYDNVTQTVSKLLQKLISIKNNNPNQDIAENINTLLEYTSHLKDNNFDTKLIIRDAFNQLEKSFKYKESRTPDKIYFQKQRLLLDSLKKEVNVALNSFTKTKSTDSTLKPIYYAHIISPLSNFILKLFITKNNNPNENITSSINKIVESIYKFNDFFDIKLIIDDIFNRLYFNIFFKDPNTRDKIALEKYKSVLITLKKEIDTALATFIQNKSIKK